MRYTKKSEKFINAYEWNRELPTKTFVQLGMNKFGQYEDIEEELGIDLLTLIKALKDGAWYIHRTEKRKYYEYEKHPQLKLNYDRWCICFDYEHCYPISLYLDKNDGWALTKEELE